MSHKNTQEYIPQNIENIRRLNLNDILNNYVRIKKEDQPQLSLSYQNICHIIMISIIIIMCLIAVFKTEITTIFFCIICIPILIVLFLYLVNYFKKRFLNIFYINTDFGKCKVKLKKDKNNSSIHIYFYKTIQTFEIKRNFLFSFFKKSNYEYTRKLIIKDTPSHINNIIEWMKDTNEELFSLYTFIKDAQLEVEYINIEEQKMHKLNVNTASITQLSQIPLIGKSNAIKIVNHIEKNGEFESIFNFAKFINLPQNKYKIIYKYINVIKTRDDLSVMDRIKQDIPKFDNTLDIL